MKKFLISVFVVIILLTTGLCCLRYNKIYLPFQEVNGVKVSFETPSTTYEQMLDKVPRTVKVTLNDEVIIESQCLEYTKPIELSQTVKQWLLCEPINVELVPKVTSQLYEDLQNIYEECKDAELIYSEDGLVLVPETVGCDFDVYAVLQFVDAGNYHVELSDYTKLPVVTTADLQEDFDKFSWLNDFSVTYSKGTIMEGKRLVPYIDNGELAIPDDFYSNLIDELKSQYNTDKKDWYFTPTGTDATILLTKSKWSTLGATVDGEKEIEFLKESLITRNSCADRVPFMNGYDTLGDTYVEISIDQQHLWYYKDGVLVNDTDIVTGHKGRHDTPLGVYYISECLRDKTLRGPGYASFVYYWMRLTNSGIGLHDATWRNKFGGDIYTYNGSHGCLNLPKDFAKQLYKDSYVGMPVIIY